MCNHENYVPSRLSPQWLCGNSCAWIHDVRLGTCLSCRKAIVVIPGRADCFYDCINIYISIYIYIYVNIIDIYYVYNVYMLFIHVIYMYIFVYIIWMFVYAYNVLIYVCKRRESFSIN